LCMWMWRCIEIELTCTNRSCLNSLTVDKKTIGLPESLFN
jgi:hypothetical protein